jgi:hypothetical protein
MSAFFRPLPLVVCAVLAFAVSFGAAAQRRNELDPVGTWSCVLYGYPAFGDERVLLRFAPDGGAQLARIDDEKIAPWVGLAGWSAEQRELRFGDPQTGRMFTANLRRNKLGGGWRTVTAVGGWWCSAMDSASLPDDEAKPLAAMPALIPLVTATPSYPLVAIRGAKEGRAIACFFVTSAGLIVEPEFIELSDEAFRAPVLSALARSRYQGWANAGTLRPSCRTYTFKLDSLLHPERNAEHVPQT